MAKKKRRRVPVKKKPAIKKIWWKKRAFGDVPIKGFTHLGEASDEGYDRYGINIQAHRLRSSETDKTVKVNLSGYEIIYIDDDKIIPNTSKTIRVNSKLTKDDWARVIKDYYKECRKKLEKINKL